MFGFNRKEKRIFGYTLFFHFLGACFLFTLGLLPSCEDKPEEIHVFELAMASDQPLVQQPTLPPPPLPTPPPVKVVSQPEKPTPVVPSKPKPPAPKPTPIPTPPPKPKVVKPKPLPRPVTPKQPKVVSFKDFQKKNNISPVKPSPRPQVSKPRVKINPNQFKLPPISISQKNSSSSSTVPASVLQAYLASVKSKLERAWKKKLGSSSIVNGGEAWLSFKISSNGSLISKRISKSSGNKDLDRLVLSASNLVGNVGMPPGGRLESELQIPFRLN
jgi:TonB family protein